MHPLERALIKPLSVMKLISWESFHWEVTTKIYVDL